MIRTFILTSVSLFSIGAVNATEVTNAPATYLLQASTNMTCEPLLIELVPQSGGDTQSLKFENGLFAAAQLTSGTYTFGNVSCTSSVHGEKSFDSALQDLEPIRLKAGQAYFGGKLIFKYEAQSNATNIPKVLDDCPVIYSKARGTSGSGCGDNVGVRGADVQEGQMKVYAPLLAKSEVTRIRDAVNANEAQLMYIPLIPDAD